MGLIPLTTKFKHSRLPGRRVWVPALILGLVALTGWSVTAAYTGEAKAAVTLATTHQAEKLTELSFNAVSYLPKTLEAGVPVSFSYNITNHESSDMEYAAVVTIVENGKPRLLERDIIHLRDGESQNVTVHFSTPNAGTAIEVIVRLPGQDLQIHFRGQS
jgi:hypothetical protein